MNVDQIKKATVSALIVWVLGVTAYVLSYFVPVLEDPEVQANWVLAITIIPATLLGAHLYYKKGYRTHGLRVGCYMFLITIVLDASITVPMFILPYGGNHISFFTDPVFWIIGLEYVGMITMYWLFKKSVIFAKITNN
ncbi:MAG: DUF5367 family protein [Bacteroidota bacterium]|uniref:DUF5367 family protein n=1 Tax=Flagellimonas okinawensis TaxID=3031324 RepID=A0ABT5XJ22_9FLAO|nr:DUF5367 family protein [[Muricauda] okinawensis]MDF0705889.1 DUF5367 family protein [[Muricauda] okinawensis]MEC8831944.1 DUF5367 family protein [Bacteroidota bacterium]